MKQFFKHAAVAAVAALTLMASLPASASLLGSPQMKIVEMGIDDLTPYAHNPRRNEAAFDSVMKSLSDFGFQQPIVVDKQNVIIVGHTRLEAAKRLGFKKVPVHVANLSEHKAKLYRIADNRTAEDADWDFDLLLSELKELDLDGVELMSTGFSETEIEKLMKPFEPEPEPEGDGTAILEAGDRVEAGDVWDLNGHQLRVGKARLPEADSIIRGWRDATGKTPKLMKTRKALLAKRAT